MESHVASVGLRRWDSSTWLRPVKQGASPSTPGTPIGEFIRILDAMAGPWQHCCSCRMQDSCSGRDATAGPRQEPQPSRLSECFSTASHSTGCRQSVRKAFQAAYILLAQGSCQQHFRQSNYHHFPYDACKASPWLMPTVPGSSASLVPEPAQRRAEAELQGARAGHRHL